MMELIATVKGIQYHSDTEMLITLTVKENEKTIINILWYIPIEEAQNYYLGQVFNVIIQRLERETIKEM